MTARLQSFFRTLKRRRHPTINVAVIALSAYLLWSYRAELRYFAMSRQPAELGALPAALTDQQFRDNRYVTIAGIPDRQHAALLKGRIIGYDSFFRLLEGQNQIFVELHRKERTTDQPIPSRFTGRLRRLSSLPYHDKVRDYFAQSISHEHRFAYDTFVNGIASGSVSTLRDIDGNDVRVGSDTWVWIDVAFPGEWIIQLAKSAFPTIEDAEKHLAAANVSATIDSESSTLFWRFALMATSPEDVAALKSQFNNPQSPTRLMPRQLSYTLPLPSIRVHEHQLALASYEKTVPRPLNSSGNALTLDESAVKAISIGAPFVIPESAMVLRAGETPQSYWGYGVIGAILALFIVINAALVVRPTKTEAEA